LDRADLRGYSIGRWTDENGDGAYDVLEVETRGFKGPRVYDATGLPLHFDNQSIFKERIFLDKADPKILHDEVTVPLNSRRVDRPAALAGDCYGTATSILRFAAIQSRSTIAALVMRYLQ
jgi:hypothetical protein